MRAGVQREGVSKRRVLLLINININININIKNTEKDFYSACFALFFHLIERKVDRYGVFG